jgi:ribosomal protein S18 acetylase RimI-like enzyme
MIDGIEEEIKLRPAAPADADILAQLWMVSFPDKFGPVLGENALPVLRDWLRLTQRHLQTTTIAETMDVVAGFIVVRTPADPIRPDEGRWLWRALQLHYGLIGALRGLVLMMLIGDNHQPETDEVYIEMLGVNPDWRGLGVARRLLAYAETMATAQNIDRLTLTVVSDNYAAIRLYEKMGFKAQVARRSRLLKWITGHPGYYDMVKQLR